MNTASLALVWRQQAVWSETASRLKRANERGRRWVLWLVIATAILETTAAQLSTRPDPGALPYQIPAALGAVLAALAAFLEQRSRNEDLTSRWIRARSASEALKEQVYRYLTRTGVYAGSDPESALREASQRVLDDVRELESDAATVQAQDRSVPAVSDLDAYVRLRVRGQAEGYYRPRSTQLAERRRVWRRAQTSFMLLTVVFGALVSFLPVAGLPAWGAVLTTLTGAIGAYIQSARFDHLIIYYRATAARLESLISEWEDTLSKGSITEEVRSNFVDRCEEAISVENQAWLAGWGAEVRGPEGRG